MLCVFSSPLFKKAFRKIEFVSYYCVKIVQILIMWDWFTMLFRSSMSFYFSEYSFY